MMRLMNNAVETEAHQAQCANHNPIELIEATIFSEKPVSRFMQTDEEAVHQMTDHEHEWHRQPDPAAIDRHREHHFSQNQTENEKLKRTPQDPMRLVHLTKVFIDGGFVHWGWFNTSEMRLSGEREFPVEPLGRSDAVTLFVARAQAADPSFELTEESRAAVEEICARLDDLPLALELAAARTKLLPPEAMLARLDERLELLSRGARDLPERHLALRNTIAWSYELLEPTEQRLFAQLAVFTGGCSLESAVAVCDATLDSTAALIDDTGMVTAWLVLPCDSI